MGLDYTEVLFVPLTQLLHEFPTFAGPMQLLFVASYIVHLVTGKADSESFKRQIMLLQLPLPLLLRTLRSVQIFCWVSSTLPYRTANLGGQFFEAYEGDHIR